MKSKARKSGELLGGVRKAFASKGDDITLSRFVKVPHDKPVKWRQLVAPGLGHPVVEAGRSLFFRKGVKSAGDVATVLVSGHSNVKIGRDVRKGALRGYWIYTLTLEERATCPRSCRHWYDCYGNNMPFAKRMQHDEELQQAIERDIQRLLAVRNRRGILVRLHALGDFYSAEYVGFWAGLLQRYPNLAVFGYTARIDGPIRRSIVATKLRFGRRFAIRFSDGGEATDCTMSIASEASPHVGAFVCPEQTGRTQACATCALCWSTDKNVAFIDH